MKRGMIIIMSIFFLIIVSIIILLNSSPKRNFENSNNYEPNLHPKNNSTIENSTELHNNTNITENSDVEEEEVEEEVVKKSPVLKNLGVNIDSLNKQTNLAGDLLFSKTLVYDDGRVSGDKVLVDFGDKDKYKQSNIGNIEYWFHVPLNTKIAAPIEGIVEIDYFEHVQDWGVNIHPQDSDLIVSFEHLIDLKVKDGEYVQAGEFIGIAAPRDTFDDKIAMTELAVWRGGTSIIKYCPFDYLEESQKQIYSERLNKLATEWEEFIGKDVYQQEKWVSPMCLSQSIQEV